MTSLIIGALQRISLSWPVPNPAAGLKIIESEMFEFIQVAE